MLLYKLKEYGKKAAQGAAKSPLRWSAKKEDGIIVALSDWMTILGGIGLFLYGMSLLGSSIEMLAGAELEKTLEKLTGNRVRGVLLGIAVTGVIQSSSATSIMVVGFINAGIMKLAQGVSVMMGANIGTTVTGQILRLGDLSGSAAMSILSPATFAPLCVAVGAFIRLLAKKHKHKMIASVAIGFGTLFIGMSMIEGGMEPLKTSAALQDIFARFENPLLGVLLGVVVVSVLQSASASVGVLQAISAAGNMTFAMAAPIVLGMNIGKFVPVIMASAGTNKKAKRAVVINIMICISGAIVFLLGMYLYQALVGFPFWKETVNRGGIANFNTIFNLATTVLMFPFCDLMIRLSAKFIPDDGESRAERELALLDSRFLHTPAVALEQAHKVVCAMAETGKENFVLSTELLSKYSEEKAAKLEENESFLDKSETALTEYVVQINAHDLDHEKTRFSQETALAICDFERIGDYCVNIADVARYMDEHNIHFSAQGNRELSYLFEATSAILDLTYTAYRETDRQTALRVEPLEETIDSMLEILKQRHTDRLERGECDVQRGISFMDLFGNVERISDHCSNVAVHVLQRLSETDDFDAHFERNEMHKGVTESYRTLFDCYRSLYIDPLNNTEK